MKIIGLDLAFAKPIQMAVLSSRGNFLWLQTIQPDESLLLTARRIHKAILPIGNSLVVYEKMGIWGNPATGMKLVQLATILFVLLSESGFSVKLIRPREWQKDILGELKKGEAKIISLREADRIFGSKIPHPLNHDEADALNIARYGVSHYRKLIKEENEL